jgi:hypothetical protein
MSDFLVVERRSSLSCLCRSSDLGSLGSRAIRHSPMLFSKTGTFRQQPLVESRAHAAAPIASRSPLRRPAGGPLLRRGWHHRLRARHHAARSRRAPRCALHEAVDSPATRDRLRIQGVEPHLLAPQEFREQVKAEIARWGPVITKAGIKASQ